MMSTIEWLCLFLTIAFGLPSRAMDCVPGVYLSTWKPLYPKQNKYIRDNIMNPIQEAITDGDPEVINSIQPGATDLYMDAVEAMVEERVTWTYSTST